MKKAKNLIAMTLIPALMPFSAYAQEVTAKTDAEAQEVTAVTPTDAAPAAETPAPAQTKFDVIKNKLWDAAKRALDNATLRRQVNLPTLSLANGLNFGGSYALESSPSIAGKYSGIDVWDVNMAAYPGLFGITLPADIGGAVSLSRQVTYIQQFNTRKESLLRVPYDPVTKLPLNAEAFFQKHKNIFTGETEQVLKPGDFIGYRAPMTFSLGRGFGHVAANHLGVSAGLSYVISGEFDVHVFVMNNKHVRVKILATKAKSKSASVGISLLGFNPLGEMVLSKLIDTQLLSVYFSKTESDLFIADYIFNLNKEDSKELYNRVVGSKLHMFSIEAIKQQILAANPFASNDSTRRRLLTNLDDLNDVSAEDLNKPYADRRIFKLLNAHNESESTSQGISLSLFKILKFNSSDSVTGSKITVYARENDSVKAKFKLDGYNTSSSYEILPAFNIWGDIHSSSNSLLTQTDLSDTPIEFIGLQNSRVREDYTLKKEEFLGLMSRLQKILPNSIYNKLEKPNWNFGAKQSVNNARIQQDITFNSNLFKIKSEINEETIKAALLKVINNYGRLKSPPMGATTTSEGQPHYRTNAFNMERYVEAYEDFELYYIPKQLAVALNSQYSFVDRYKAFNFLYEKVPLFAEISTVLLLKLIPENELEKVVIVRFAMSARNQTTVISDYPTTEAFNTSNLFREILAQNGYINDQSYNLRNYLKEDGSQYTIDEIMVEKK